MGARNICAENPNPFCAFCGNSPAQRDFFRVNWISFSSNWGLAKFTLMSFCSSAPVLVCSGITLVLTRRSVSWLPSADSCQV
ncbi:MAG: hypothetical protein JWQ62_47 [Lacunisphaera sp.]|nr:hypothetical protein [Lacunisphaera sp.]